MNRTTYRCYPPPRKKKRKCDCKKIGIALLGVGLITILTLLLPLKCWLLLLCLVLIVCGFLLIRK